jgi:DNA gyrase subunit A
MMLVSKNGVVIRTTLKEVPVQGRSTSGVTVMRLDSEDQVAAIAAIDEDDASANGRQA